MASTNRRSTSTGNTTRKNTTKSTKRTSTNSKKKTQTPSKQVHRKAKKKDNIYFDDILVIVTIATALLLFLSNFNIIGAFGKAFNEVAFGIFGVTAYVIPFVLVFCVFIYLANKGNTLVFNKIGLSAVFSLCLSGLIQLFNYNEKYSFGKYYDISMTDKTGGGFIGGFICKILCPFIGFWGTLIVLVAVEIILFIMITEKLLVTKAIKNGGTLLGKAIEYYKNKEYYEDEYYEDEENYDDSYYDDGTVEVKRKAKFYTFSAQDFDEATEENKAQVVKKTRKTKRKENVVKDNIANGNLPKTDSNCEEIYQTELNNKFKKPDFLQYNETIMSNTLEESNITVNSAQDSIPDMIGVANSLFEEEPSINTNPEFEMDSEYKINSEYEIKPDYETNKNTNEYATEEFATDNNVNKNTSSTTNSTLNRNTKAVVNTTKNSEAENTPVAPIGETDYSKYRFPPLSLLAAPKGGKKQNMSEHQKTAIKLKETLCSFGVEVTLSDISVGPSVTRYELIPKQGVKVSRITNLSDDIKLSLAATDIRIEAPIPGKSAIGIEVPNKENTAVYLRELFEDEKFTNKKNNISFAVGKDISGQPIVTDISKMPHLLIAGQTGSGKSVCINTIIMSILYSAHPDDVKLLMIDPKVVELSVYNGIPHLLAPVVTDPKKASGTLAWAVSEMTERYNKFAALGVRDIASYNKRVTSVKDNNLPNFQKMPQIVIVVDELADLMMVAASDVEDSICRLAQMARAAGMYLIIATQRPSVNVITGIIKANVPSRIAFSVASQVDSRTILDGAGAEKLLGRGDMLFYPSGYPKPVRIQGAFVSESEVSSVVDFLSKDNEIPNYDQEVITKIDNAAKTSTGGGADDGKAGQSSRDAYYVEAGRYIIEKDKASIGMLQRVYKIGFNRAARIMDQLSEDGVVGPEEGTKPRKVLMTLEEFEKFVEECV